MAERAGPLSAAVASEVRAELGRRRLSGRALARGSGLEANYVAVRLRGDAPFTLNDVERVAAVLRLTGPELVARAARSARLDDSPPPDIDDLAALVEPPPGTG